MKETIRPPVDVLIIGGGLCGVLAAKQCLERNLTYCLVERQSDLGGVWASLANEHSHLQAFEAMYRWHDEYPLGPNPMAKISGPIVLRILRRFAKDSGVYSNAVFRTDIRAVTFCNQTDSTGSPTRDLRSDLDKFIAKGQNDQENDFAIHSTYLIVTSGILGGQHTLQERGIRNETDFKGTITFAGRSNGMESAAGKADANGKVVAILGTGAFACEAMEACIRNCAAHVYLMSRERIRWVLPFSRQFTITFVTYIPFLPWRWKMALLKAYLSGFYRRAGMLHMMPKGENMDYTGQCNDAFFRLPKQRAVTFVLDTPVALSDQGVLCKSGLVLQADMIVNASGCRFNARPDFLQPLDVGYDSMHNYAFLGPSGRIGTASDFVYAFVPHGPKKQLDLVFHAISCHQRGLSAELQKTLQPTPIVSKEGASPCRDTWFTTSKWYSTLNTGMKDRNELYVRTMSVGVQLSGRLRLRWSLAIQQTVFWLLSGCLALVEICRLHIFD